MTAVYHRGAATTPTSKDDWQTPEYILDRVRYVGAIGLDPCTSADNPVRAQKWLTSEGLSLWPRARGLAFVNPPYSELAAWAERIAAESAHRDIVSLVPARTDTKAFARLAWDTADAVAFLKGRIRFIDPATGEPAMVWSKAQGKLIAASAPFPSAVIYHGGNVRRFARAFEGTGRIVRL